MMDNKAEKKHIQGGEVFITESPDKAYRVQGGSILVYLMPVKQGKMGRRMLLKEMPEGSVIPSLAYDSKVLGSWRFGFVALNEAELEETSGKAADELWASFAEAVKLKRNGEESYEEAFIELYNINSVKEEGYIYSTKQGIEATRARSYNMIRDVFSIRGIHGETEEAHSGNPLYDCAAILCAREKIHIAPIDKIYQSAGRRLTINDIARVSHFTVREILLQEGWHRRDQGAFIAYSDKDGQPYVIIPKRIGRYLAYDPKTGETISVGSDFAMELKPQAVMFYRPFPDEKITLAKLISFGMEKVYRSDIIRVVLLAVIGVLTGLQIPFLNEQVYDKFIPLGNKSGLLQVGSVILACALGNITFTIVKNLSVFRAMNTMEYAVQSATIDRLFSLPESFLRKYDAADLGMRTMNISRIYNIIAQGAVKSLLSALFSLIYLFRMVKYSKDLTKRALIMLIAVMAIVVIMGIQQMKYEKEKLTADNAANSNMFQFINGIEKLRMGAAENRALVRYLTDFIRSRRINLRKEKMTIAANTLVGASELIFSIVFYYVMVRKGLELSIGGFTGFTAAFGALSGATLELVGNFLVLNQIKPMYDMARPILEELPENAGEVMMPSALTGDIEIDNVTFRYDAYGDDVLSDINLHFTPGEYVGIVGASGCGKSTLIKLLMGFEKPQLGKIYYDGQDIDELDKRELRKQFGVVLQDGGLISGNIYDNITITSPGLDMDRVQEVICEVGLKDDIDEMPMGLYTSINEMGSTISGGQAQRILIARAIAGKPKIIFFDEATSALDNTTQEQVMNTLEKLDATKLVIAHRLSTIVNCDRIIVMDGGRVVEEGSYKELMEKKGRFYELAVRQII